MEMCACVFQCVFVGNVLDSAIHPGKLTEVCVSVCVCVCTRLSLRRCVCMCESHPESVTEMLLI